MNSQSHVIINLVPQLKLAKEDKPAIVGWAVFGSLLPDIPMFFFFVYATFIKGLPQGIIWQHAYYQHDWQVLFNVFNSIPIYLLLFGLFYYFKRTGPALFALGGLLHGLGDLFLHHDDGHAHFWPFSDWVFQSPVSYWDPAHYGYIAAPLETLLVLGLTIFLWRGRKLPARIALVLMNLLNLSGLIATFIFFG